MCMVLLTFKQEDAMKYFITFTNDFSSYGYVYLMHRKPESFEMFKEFKAKAEKQLKRPLKALL